MSETNAAETATAPERMVHFRWDLDKTYIYTEFDSLRDLVATWRQRPEEKENVPGAATMLRELLARDTPVEKKVTFISGSPRQMRRVLTEKLRLDGIEPDQFILKPNLSNLLLFRFKSIRSQIGYKLAALLESRLFGDRIDEVLFGDDSEQDGLIYSLYADLLEGAVTKNHLEWILYTTDTPQRESRRILELVDHLPVQSVTHVRRIFIHLERRSPTGRFDVFGRRVVPIFNYLQAALVLVADGLLGPDSVLRVSRAMRDAGYTRFRLGSSVHDIVRRGYVPESTLARVRERASEHDAPLFDVGPAQSERPQPWSDVDYAAAARAVRKYRRERATFSAIRWVDE